jgi:hypothetical protein
MANPNLIGLVPASGLGFVLRAGCQTAVGSGGCTRSCIHEGVVVRGGGGKWAKEEDENENDRIGRFAEFQTPLESRIPVY